MIATLYPSPFRSTILNYVPREANDIMKGSKELLYEEYLSTKLIEKHKINLNFKAKFIIKLKGNITIIYKITFSNNNTTSIKDNNFINTNIIIYFIRSKLNNILVCYLVISYI